MPTIGLAISFGGLEMLSGSVVKRLEEELPDAPLTSKGGSKRLVGVRLESTLGLTTVAADPPRLTGDWESDPPLMEVDGKLEASTSGLGVRFVEMGIVDDLMASTGGLTVRLVEREIVDGLLASTGGLRNWRRDVAGPPVEMKIS